MPGRLGRFEGKSFIGKRLHELFSRGVLHIARESLRGKVMGGHEPWPVIAAPNGLA
jgi:hypothetical protein